MRPQEKKLLLDNLIDLRRRLVWAAQSQEENLQAYSGRVQKTYEVYVKAGEIASKEFVEVMESKYEKERLAIFCYVNGMQLAIKRYMCEPEFYYKFEQARHHAEQIAYHLNDLANLGPIRVCSNIP